MTRRLFTVLHVITRLIPGGAQDNTILTVERSRRYGFDAVLACAPEPRRVEDVRSKGIEVILIPEFRREISPFNDVIALIRLYRIIRRRRFHIVHTHTSKAGVLGRIAAKLAGTPVIVHTSHGSIFHPIYFRPSVLWFFSLVERFAAGLTDKIITISEDETDDYLQRRIAGNEKFIVIPSGVDTQSFPGRLIDKDKKRGDLGLPGDVPIVGMIARLAPEKGHDVCLQAFQQVVRAFPKACLLIVGEGELREDIRERISRLGLEKSVVMLGYRKDIPEITQILDVSVHPSFMEGGVSRSVVESMLCKVPVVAAAVGGIPEVVMHEKNGLLVPPGDATALAQAIIRLLNDGNLRSKLADAAYGPIQKTHSLETMTDKIFRLYGELLVKADIKRPPQQNACRDTL